MRDELQSLRADDGGVTAFQTVVVIAIMCCVVYFAMPHWALFVKRVEARSCQSNQRGIAEAIAVAREDGAVRSSVGYYDAALTADSEWGKMLIPDYLSRVPKCPSSQGSLYNVSPLGAIWSDRGSGQYSWVGSDAALSHRLAP